jgi:hypothetical protein
MATPPESAGQTRVEHDVLHTAASNSLPEQRSALDSTKRTVLSREVPAAAFSELGAQASAGHKRNIGEITDRMDGADERYAAVIQGVGDTTDRFRAMDEDQAERQRRENVELVAARAGQQTSQNGWPVNPPLKTRWVPGSSNTRMTLADGPAGDLLNHVAGQLQQRVESFDLNPATGPRDDGGYNYRPIAGSSTISNHASGTAFDLNATLHPQHASGTFTPAQVTEIHSILDEVDGVVRWGGDYSPQRIDEMHFEIVGTPAEVSRVWDRIRLEIERTP